MTAMREGAAVRHFEAKVSSRPAQQGAWVLACFSIKPANANVDPSLLLRGHADRGNFTIAKAVLTLGQFFGLPPGQTLTYLKAVYAEILL